MLLLAGAFAWGISACPAAPGGCRQATIEGEVKAGGAFTRPIGNGLSLLLEPLPSGWILRIVPASGPRGDHDYAELATPPYHSVSPLLVSTDFAFRAQDAVGWNPRRFHFATNAESYGRLRAAYRPYEDARAKPTPAEERNLAAQLGGTSEGVLEIVDARLIAGTADQWTMAAAVSSHFTATAHTIEDPPNGKTTPLGRITWMRFRVKLDLPSAGVFKPATGLQVQIRPCSGS
jgi:hypothetical protein